MYTPDVIVPHTAITETRFSLLLGACIVLVLSPGDLYLNRFKIHMLGLGENPIKLLSILPGSVFAILPGAIGYALRNPTPESTIPILLQPPLLDTKDRGEYQFWALLQFLNEQLA